MKHPVTTRLLASHLEALGIQLSEQDAGLVIRHMEHVLSTNEHLNLTALRDPYASLRLNVVDSLSALPEVESAPEGILIDIGTGGGFPGLPLAVASRRTAILMDSVKKKAVALQRFLVQESLESWISVSDERAETLGSKSPQIASVVVARAVATLPVLVELAAPLLSRGGMLVALKARPSDMELHSGRRAAEICGLEEADLRILRLPDGDELRTVVSYVRIGNPSVELPRRTGVAQKRPLA